jgi:hypothetical protein
VKDVVSLARGARTDARTGPIVVSGVDTSEVEKALGEGADAGSVVVRSDPAGAVAVVRVIAGEVGAADREVLRAAARASVPLVVLVRDPAITNVPYVLATSIVVWPRGSDVPKDELVRVLASTLGEESSEVGARVPVLRDATVHRLVVRAATSSAALAFLRGKSGPLAPVLALHQARTLRRLARTRGASSPADPQGLASEVGPELGAAVVTGFLARGIVRRLPVRNRVIEAGVAAAGTFAVTSLAGPLSRVARAVAART